MKDEILQSEKASDKKNFESSRNLIQTGGLPRSVLGHEGHH